MSRPDLEALFAALGDEETWERHLARAAHPEASTPYVKTDTERALDREAWDIYAQQKKQDDREISTRAAATQQALEYLQRLPRDRRAGRERFVCYCPQRIKPCRLVVGYEWTAPRQTPIGGAQTLLLVAHNGKNIRAFFPDWSVAGDRLDPVHWLPIRCPHGTGRFTPYIPGQIINHQYRVSSGQRARRISDLVGVSGIEWTSATSMLSR